MITKDDIIIITTLDGIDARPRLIKVVTARIPGYDDSSDSGLKIHVKTGVSVYLIVTTLAVDSVVAGTAGDKIITTAAGNVVITRAAVKGQSQAGTDGTYLIIPGAVHAVGAVC